MFRETDIRSEISGWLDTLVELYEETDPLRCGK
jgi:hypothetical protein